MKLNAYKNLKTAEKAAGKTMKKKVNKKNANEWPAVYIIFVDVVRFSLNKPERQKKIIDQMKGVVSATKFFKDLERKRHICLTGDGFVLIYPDSGAANSAIETLKFTCHLQKKLKEKGIPVRIGLNYGKVFDIDDFDKKKNYVGVSINDCQRVMDLGDAGHILMHEDFYALVEGSIGAEKEKEACESLGSVLVKHGINIVVHNYVSEDAGNSEMPKKARQKKIVEDLILYHLAVLLDKTETAMKELWKIGKDKAQLRMSILFFDKYEEFLFVSPHRVHYQLREKFTEVKSNATFGKDRNPVWTAYDKNKILVLNLPDPDEDFDAYKKYWRSHYREVTSEKVDSFTRPSRCYLYIPLALVHPSGKKAHLRIKLGVLCMDSMALIPEGEKLQALLGFLKKEAANIEYLLSIIR